MFELIQNGWDAEPSHVLVSVEAIAGQPYALVTVGDDSGEGWADLADAFTMFGRSRRAGDVQKRGRFCFGEKLALSLCRKARISTMQGTMIFDEEGRRRSSEHTARGTLFVGEMRMTRDELAEVMAQLGAMVPPVPTTLNGTQLDPPKLLKTFHTKLPTEVADVDGVLRKTVREATVQVFDGPGA